MFNLARFFHFFNHRVLKVDREMQTDDGADETS